MKTHLKCISVLLGMVCVLSQTNPVPVSGTPGGSDQRASGPATEPELTDTAFDSNPELVLQSGADGWLIGGGFIYFWSCVYHSDPPGLRPSPENLAPGITTDSYTGFLKRRPINGGIERTLSSAAFCGDAVAADEGGLYYYDRFSGNISKRTVDSPDIAVSLYSTPQPASGLVLDAERIYWIDPDSRFVQSVTRRGESFLIHAATGTQPSDLTLGGTTLYWFDSSGLRTIETQCAPCAPGQLTSERGRSLKYAPHRQNPDSLLGRRLTLYWIVNDEIHAYGCSGLLTVICSVTTLYPTPANPLPGGWRLASLVREGAYVFWTEHQVSCTPFCVNIDARLKRLALDGGGVQTVVGPTNSYELNRLDRPLQAYARYIYFNYSPGVGRVPVDAPPTAPDLALEQWEVTQGIQSLNNDVPLVAKKPTYVRVYGRLLSGPRVNAAEAVLVGMRGGTPLPGSPLSPLNGPQSMLQQGSWTRSIGRDGFLFQLPTSWLETGEISLQARLDPRGVYGDPNPGNNTLQGAFSFGSIAPECIMFVPVRTNAPPASTSNTNFRQMIARMETLWPVPEIRVYHQDNDVAKGIFSFSPYDIPANQDRLMINLIERELFSDDPDECDEIGALTHYVGMVHAETNTGSNGGYGNYVQAVAYVKLPPHNRAGVAASGFFAPRAGSTLAHEMSHNYNGIFGSRWKHVNCALSGPDGVNTAYPYAPCRLDNRARTDPAAHFGFDPITLQAVAPDLAADYMSYGAQRWVSDYTWVGMQHELSERSAARLSLTAQRDASGANMDTGAVAYATGSISSGTGQATLDGSFVYPPDARRGALSSKWQRFAANAISGADHASSITESIHLQVLDTTGAVLGDYPVVALPNHEDASGDHAPFVISFPPPSGSVQTLRLLSGTTVLSTLTPGLATPRVQVVAPTTGDTITDTMTIIWRAVDDDPHDLLRYNVQYSPDAGRTWRAIATGVQSSQASETVTLTLRSTAGLPGSAQNGALIRVAASDGFHTGFGLSQPFHVRDHAPIPYITTPHTDKEYAVSEAIVLRGGADDSEDGPLDGSALIWHIDGRVAGVGPLLPVFGIAPGEHRVSLTTHDSSGNVGSISSTLRVAPLVVPAGEPPVLDGSCTDGAYAPAARLGLAPYNDAAQAQIQIVRSESALWVCFSNLKHAGAGSPGTRAGVHVDVNASQDALAQTTDLEFSVGADGTPQLRKGDGAGGFVGSTLDGLSARVSSIGSSWSAELHIPSAALGGWNHAANISFFQYWVDFVGNDFQWPYAASWNGPSTWATAALGDVSAIDSVYPQSVLVDSQPMTLAVNGGTFLSSSVVYLDGAARPTRFVSPAMLEATLSANDLKAARNAAVTVVNVGHEKAPSGAVPFTVTNPRPVLNRVTQHASRQTITAYGTNFVAGAQIVIDGIVCPTTFVNASTMTAETPDHYRAGLTRPSVVVLNPAPHGGVSEVMRIANAQYAYLPALTR